ncbi:hypothetical protein IAR55_002336 [Kwoniella newhampshirensis]|uniref:Uncharacterized protein n=1 Tax=Kwoniella newhampshirensis TaxID=1651941 RepID=A0AAW0YQL1_9TREE
MRFTSPDSRPALTPFGHRLLHLSEQKLSSLDDDLHDGGHGLWKGVVVREAVRSAWKSVEEGSVVEMNDWSAMSAMGLTVVSEEVEDETNEDEDLEGEQREARWFEDLMSNIGDEDSAYVGDSETSHEWVESDVSEPVYDFDYEFEGIQAFTFPTPTSPTSPPVVPITIASLSEVAAMASATVEVSPVSDVAEEDEDEYEVEKTIQGHHRHHHLRHHHTYGVRYTSGHRRAGDTDSQPPQPIIQPFNSPTLMPPSPFTISGALNVDDNLAYPDEAIYYADLDDYVDELCLPPPLLRSLSSSSSDCDGAEECETPGCSDCESDCGSDRELDSQVSVLLDGGIDKEQHYFPEIALLYGTVVDA